MDKPTIQTYNLLAQEYDQETATFWERFPRDFFNRFVEKVRGPVLDIGAGPGRDGLIMQGLGLDVTCLDASESMVQLAASRGLKTIQADFNHLPFKDSSFAAAWAYTSLLHVPKAKVHQPLAEIHRILQPKGILGLGMMEGHDEGYRESSGVKKPRWFSYYSEDDLRQLMTDSGFEVLYFVGFVPLPSRHRYLNFIALKV